ncbi:HNH endonuclease signature motif containing protein, partial [Jiangella asiatica]
APEPASVAATPLAAVPTGPWLAAALATFETAAAGGYHLVEAAAGWARLAAWVAAKQASVLAALAARPELRPADTGYRSLNPITNTAVEIAARTHLTTRQAENQVGHAVQLVEDFPATHAMVEAGRIDERRARVITAELGGQEPQVRRRIEAAVLPAAPGLDSVELRRTIQELLHDLAPVGTERRCQQARERRDVTMIPAEDGMAHLQAYLPAEDAVAVTSVLHAAADTLKRHDAAAGCEPRTAAQRRADALAALAWAALDSQRIGGGTHRLAHRPGCPCTCDRTHPDAGIPGRVTPAHGRDAPDGAQVRSAAGQAVSVTLAAAQGRPVSVHLTVALSSVIGMDDRPGHLAGYGPIPAQIARHLAAAGTWQWVGTHPATGHVLDHGTTRYRPPQALIDHVVLRDRTCRTPGCHRPAIRCDIDHHTPHAAGGPTSACNCQPLCRHHHLLKHRGGWTVHRDTTGNTVWTSPTGHTYIKPPERIGPAKQ